MDKVFKLTNKYLVLATPLILFSLVSNIYVAFSLQGRIINLIIALFLLILMTGAFLAGWFFMIKKVVTEPLREDTNTLMGEFPSGVGEYFLPTTVVVINAILILAVFIMLAYFAGTKLIGDVGISPDTFYRAMENTQAMKTFMTSLTANQILKINQWNLLLLFSMLCSNFITIFYLPALFFKDKNPFKALFISIKDLFTKKFLTTFGIGVLIFITYLVFTILMSIFSGSIILHFILSLANFYFMMVVGVGIFYYYYHNFVKPIGQNIDVEI